jgi:CHAD domain-containing protein
MTRRGSHGGARRAPSAKRALHLQLRRAIAKLGGKAPLRDVSVHEVRKELKRARATLRLLRDGIGETAYRRANRRLRDAARPLSRVRDARVLLDVVAKLRGGAKNASRRAELASLEQRLRRERHRARGEVLDRQSPLRRIRSSIDGVLSESRSWCDPGDESLRRGMERIYRKGCKAFTCADQDASDEMLHEWRKQTKYLRQALEVLAPACRGAIAKRTRGAESIADALGDDHDLAVLQQKLATRSRSGSSRREVLSRIERRRRQLQKRAAKQSRHLYRHEAEAFVDALDLRTGTR